MRPTFVNAEWQEAFERDGYVKIPCLDQDQVQALRDVYYGLGKAPGDPERACISTFHTYDAEYKQKISDGVHGVLKPHCDEIFDDYKCLPANFLTKWPGGMSGFGLHQDLALVDETKYTSAEIWVALEDTHEDNGQLWMVPGSHKWVPTLRGIHSFRSPFYGLEQRIVQRHAKPEPLKAGEAIVFNHATLHFSYPNRTQKERLVAIIDLIPNEAQHIHYFGLPDGSVEAFEIGEEFWVDNNPFTLGTPPPAAQSLGIQEFEFVALTEERLDQLVAEGKAIDHEAERHGALNPGKAWCHRCGTTEGIEEPTDRWLGNVTLLCPSCAEKEAELAPV